jgi:hypothetical protein
MKSIHGVYLITVSLLMVACDPAITIHQIKSPNEDLKQSKSPNELGQIKIDVKRQNSFIGHTWYVPQVTVTNGSGAPIRISSVDLATKLGTYVNKPRQNGSYPLDVQPGETEPLDIWFDLTDDVKKTFFRQPAELLMHYSSRGRNETVHASIVGGPLDTTVP